MPPVDLRRGGAVKTPRPLPLPPLLPAPRSAPRVAPGTELTPRQQAAAAAPYRRAEAPQEAASRYVAAAHATRPVAAPVSPVTHAQAVSGQHAAAQERAALANPDAAQRHAAALALMRAQSRHLGTKLGGPSISVANTASINLAHQLHPDWASFVRPLPGVLGHLGEDLVTLPRSTVQGLWEGGKAIVHDVGHPAATFEHPLNSATVKLAETAARTDPLFNLLTLHPARALHLAEQHPLQAIADVGAAGGVVGRLAGAGARATGVADALAPTARAPRELIRHDQLDKNTARAVANLQGIEQRHSPNLLVAALQHAADRHPPAGRGGVVSIGAGRIKVPVSAFDREMFKRANEHRLLSDSLSARYAEQERRRPTTPDMKPLDQRVRSATAQAKRDATLSTYRANALLNPQRGDIFYSGKRLTPTRAMTKLSEQHGLDFVRVRLPRTKGGKSQSVIVPRTLHETIQKHEALASAQHGAIGEGARWFTQRFRRTVLPFSTKWIMGNVTEAGLRTALAGVRPWHANLGGKLIDNMRQMGLHNEADRLEAQALQGTHFSMQARHANEYLAEHPHAAARAAGKVMHAAGKPADISFKGNAAAEQAFARAVLGKFASTDLKAIERMHPDWTRQEAIDELSRQYGSAAKASQAGRYGRQVLGKYAAFGPSTQQFIRSIAPFSPWYGNAVKFMGGLPVRHPVFTAGALGTARATDKQWKKEHEAISGLGGDVQGFPMTSKYGAFDLGRYLPPGAFSGGEGMKPTNAVIADLLPILGPQWADSFKAAVGLDPFGNALSYPGPGSKLTPTGRISHQTTHSAKTGIGAGDIGNVLSPLLAAGLGPTSQIRRIVAERGATPYSGKDFIWNWNPPTKDTKGAGLQGILAGLNKVLNPVKPINLKPRHHKAGSRSAPSKFGGESGGSTRRGSTFGGSPPSRSAHSGSSTFGGG